MSLCKSIIFGTTNFKIRNQVWRRKTRPSSKSTMNTTAPNPPRLVSKCNVTRFYTNKSTIQGLLYVFYLTANNKYCHYILNSVYVQHNYTNFYCSHTFLSYSATIMESRSHIQYSLTYFRFHLQWFTELIIQLVILLKCVEIWSILCILSTGRHIG